MDNFLAVTRARPTEDEELQSEENFSDEELIVTPQNIADVLKTRIGSGPKRKENLNADDAGAEDEDDDTHIPESSKEAFRTAQNLWKSGASTDTYQRPADSNVSQEDLEKAIASAKMSQKTKGLEKGAATMRRSRL